MFKMTKYIIPLVVFLLILFFLWRGLSISPHVLPSALIGKTIPQFELLDLLHSGKNLSSQDFKGKITVFNVWASWCVACRLEHPIFERITQIPGIQVYGLNYKDEPNQAKYWLERYGSFYQKVGVDDQGNVAINFGVYGTPETFIIDQQSLVRFRYVGAIDLNILQTKIFPCIDALKNHKETFEC